MATGGDRNAACRFTATSVANSTGSTLKCASSGMNMGTKMTMISVHSRGHPRRKIMACETIKNWIGVRLSERTQFSIHCWPPCNANTAENSAEPTKSQHPLAVVFAVRNVDSLTFWRSYGEGRRNNKHG